MEIRGIKRGAPLRKASSCGYNDRFEARPPLRTAIAKTVRRMQSGQKKGTPIESKII
jgi:hypothetical protein